MSPVGAFSNFQSQPYTVVFSTTPQFDFSNSDQQKILLTANVISSTFVNACIGQIVLVTLTQDGAGGHTFVWPANVSWGSFGPPVRTLGANSSDTFIFRFDGLNFVCLLPTSGFPVLTAPPTGQSQGFAYLDGTTIPFTLKAWDGANWRAVGSLISQDSRALQGVMLETARLSVGLQCLLGSEITDADVISELRTFLDSDTAMANLATMLDQMRQPTSVYLRNVVVGTYVANARDVVLANASTGGVTVQVPNGLNAVVSVKKVDSSTNAVTITPSGGTIDGAANLVLSAQYQSRTIAGDGVNCWVI